MDEKIIIKSEHYNAKKAKKIAVIIGIALAILCIVVALFSIVSNYSEAFGVSLPFFLGFFLCELHLRINLFSLFS